MSAARKPSKIAAICIPIAVVSIVMVVATPAIDDLDQQSEVRNITRLIDRVELAARRYNADTGLHASECAAPSADHEFMASRYHELSVKQLHEGWKGPYLDHPLSIADNPYRKSLELRRDLESAPAQGFLIGDTDNGRGRGQYLAIEGVPREVAQLINAHYDGDENRDWTRHGRVEWIDGMLSVFLFR